jgi:hypothetical protein
MDEFLHHHSLVETPMVRHFLDALLRIAGALEKPPKPSEPILTILHTLANAEHGECYCRIHKGDCPGGDCDGCLECPTGRARSVLVAMEDEK